MKMTMMQRYLMIMEKICWLNVAISTIHFKYDAQIYRPKMSRVGLLVCICITVLLG